jgi:hypothetical protein
MKDIAVRKKAHLEPKKSYIMQGTLFLLLIDSYYNFLRVHVLTERADMNKDICAVIYTCHKSACQLTPQMAQINIYLS